MNVHHFKVGKKTRLLFISRHSFEKNKSVTLLSSLAKLTNLRVVRTGSDEILCGVDSDAVDAPLMTFASIHRLNLIRTSIPLV
jgi:hypothetical protein